jgi:hypothetical protein
VPPSRHEAAAARRAADDSNIPCTAKHFFVASRDGRGIESALSRTQADSSWNPSLVATVVRRPCPATPGPIRASACLSRSRCPY